MYNFILSLPLWQLIRGLGLISYVLLTAGIGLGISYGFPFWKGKSRAGIYKLHIWATNSGMAIGFLHGMITVIDTYMPFSWYEIFIPFVAKHSPILNGLGTLAAYGMLVVVFTSDIRSKLKKHLWHLLHLLSYPVFILSFIHGYYIGTDTSSPGVKWMYGLSIAFVLALTIMAGALRATPKVAIIPAKPPKPLPKDIG